MPSPTTVAPSAVAEPLKIPQPLSVASKSSLAPGVYVLAAAAIVLHLVFSGRYGYFRDELYYAACGEHPAWGYLDHAPLAPLIARIARTLLGNSLFALRFFPALAAGAKVYLTGWIARETGGSRFAQFFAGLMVFCAPIYLTFDSFFSMNSFEPLFWMACAAIAIRILNGGSRKLWLLFGLVAGIGTLNKHSMLFFSSGICVGLLLTAARREYSRPWIWLGILLAWLIFLPNLLWEFINGWPTIALLNAVSGTKYATVTPWEYVWQQSLLTHPLATPFWIAGLWYFLRDHIGKQYRPLGWAYLVVLSELIALHGKIYYLAPAYPMLLAAGAVWTESRLLARTGEWLKPAVVVPLVMGAAIAAPLAMPILPVELAVKYCRFWDVKAIKVENMPLGELPQLFGDMYGWPEQAQTIARVFDTLTPQERARCAILAYNYGEASAVDYFGPQLGLPKAISGHNQYGMWGPRQYQGDTVIAIGFGENQLYQLFQEVTPAAQITSRYAIPEETNLTIYLCRKPRKSLRNLWQELRWLG